MFQSGIVRGDTGDGTRWVLRTSLPRGASHLHRVRRGKTNKHWKRKKESSRTVCLIKAQVIEFGNEATWSTRRVERVPGTPFSWETCDETKVAALPRSRGQGDGRKLETPRRRCRKSAMRGQFLFCCSLQPSFQQRVRWSKVLNSHVKPKLKCSGPTGHAVGHVEFQRQRADIADDQILSTPERATRA